MFSFAEFYAGLAEKFYSWMATLLRCLIANFGFLFLFFKYSTKLFTSKLSLLIQSSRFD